MKAASSLLAHIFLTPLSTYSKKNKGPYKGHLIILILPWQTNLISSLIWVSSHSLAFTERVKPPNYIFSPDLSPELTIISPTSNSLSTRGSLISISNVRCLWMMGSSCKSAPPQLSHLSTWQPYPFSSLIQNLGSIFDSASSLMPHTLLLLLLLSHFSRFRLCVTP